MILNEKWSIEIQKRIITIDTGDINNNSEIELIIGTFDGYLYLISRKGQILKKISISKDSPIYHLKHLYSNQNDENCLIIGGKDGLLRFFKISNDLSNQLIWKHKFNSLISGFLIDDLTNDNNSEIIAYSLDNTLRILNLESGSLIWGQVFEKGIGDCMIFPNIEKEVIACGNDGTLRSFDSKSGDLLWYKKYHEKMRCLSQIRTKKKDLILCGGDDKKIHIIDRKSLEEKCIHLNNFVWKSLSNSGKLHCNKSFFSTYSFEHFLKTSNENLSDIESEVVSIDQNCRIVWSKKNLNAEELCFINVDGQKIIIIGDSFGKFLLLNKKSGRIIKKLQFNSPLNAISSILSFQELVLGFEDGYIKLFEYKK